MTLGIAVAVHQGSQACVWLAADTRLTLSESDSYDSATKGVQLGPRSALLMAGSSVLPVLYAAEQARPIIDATRRGGHRVSLWHEAQIFDQCLSHYAVEFPRALKVDVTIVGFMTDGSPAIARIMRMPPPLGQFGVIHRATPGAPVSIAVGDPEFARYLRYAAPPHQSDMHQTLSVLWDIAAHRGDPTRGIGGHLCLGWCRATDESFQWPLLEHPDGVVTSRGMQMPTGFTGPPTPMKLEHDPETFAALEKTVPQWRPREGISFSGHPVPKRPFGVLAGEPERLTTDPKR